MTLDTISILDGDTFIVSDSYGTRGSTVFTIDRRGGARFEEPDEKGIMRLYCSILVERGSQKAIVVGRAGEMIKRIGTTAREELERFFDARVYLDLHVKVKAEWREDERLLDDLLR